MNLTLHEYEQLNATQKEELVQTITQIRPDLQFDSFITGCRYSLPRFWRQHLNMYFIYIPGGTFNMGLSEEEEKAALKITDPLPRALAERPPVQKVTLNNFLVMETPVLTRHALSFRAYVHIYDATIEIPFPNIPYWAEFRTANGMADVLDAHLPTECQREYFCRGNTQSLFCFGDVLPSKKELEAWFNRDFAHLHTAKRNNFGICGLFGTEWTSDFFRSGYSRKKIDVDTRVLRGGGADFWPFASKEEWIWCASAIRMPSTFLVDDTAKVRLVINLG